MVKNSADNVFSNLSTSENEPQLFREFLNELDLSPHSVRAIKNDIKKFASWYVTANNELFNSTRITTSDVASFRDHLRRDQGQAVATVNRCLISIRKYLKYLHTNDKIRSNPAASIKELRKQQLAPQGLTQSQVRKLLREVELHNDIRAKAIFTVMLYTGARVSDIIQLEHQDLIYSERSGTVIFRFRKGGKQTNCPLPLPARKAIQEYLQIRPNVNSSKVFLGERGEITDRAIRAMCDKYSAICGFHMHAHLLRHTMAHQYLRDTGNDLVGLAQILGHESLNTTSRYTQRTEMELQQAAERMAY